MFLARWAIRIVFGLIALVVLYLGITFAQVWWASRGNDTSPASAIIVMGAAQWNGVPSPVLKGRLDHAVDLYERGVAPVIVVTGGKQTGDAVTQGLSGFAYLRDRGVPESAIKIEVDGTNSFEELSASAAILRRAGIGDSVVIVSDPYHAFRVETIAREVGLKPHVSTTNSPSSFRPMLRETVAVAIGRIIGFRRLASLR
jgi:uncharacterized SAM-binding protein YcdF (DUF218 family)